MDLLRAPARVSSANTNKHLNHIVGCFIRPAMSRPTLISERRIAALFEPLPPFVSGLAAHASSPAGIGHGDRPLPLSPPDPGCAITR